ncbi:MAG: ThiF family adenylyltransferase [Acidobacteriaceae bacterium]
MKLRISAKHYQEMCDLLALSFLSGKRLRPETGCILLIARNDHLLNPAMLVAGVVAPGPEDFSRQHSDALSFSSSYLRRALLNVRQRGLAGFLTVHTHPLADEFVRFSQYDDDNDPDLMANLYDLQPEGTFGSMVLGKRSASARLWTSNGDTSGLSEIVIVGERYQSEPLDGTTASVAPDATEIFDRGLAITGTGGLAKLSRMRIGVSGVSGTGSIVVELLLRAGAGEIVLFDFDKTELANLNRILHSRVVDANASTLKSERAAAAAKDTGLPTKITVIKGGDIRNAVVAEELKGCDRSSVV